MRVRKSEQRKGMSADDDETFLEGLNPYKLQCSLSINAGPALVQLLG